jgi:Domain of unknown function (DUF4845)
MVSNSFYIYIRRTTMRAGWRSTQRGATLLGILIIGGILAFAVYAGIRLVPLYVDYMSVSKVLNRVAKSGSNSVPAIKQSLQAAWTADYISTVNPEDIEITPTGSGTFKLRANYRAEAPFVANVSLVVDFDKEVTTSGGGP